MWSYGVPKVSLALEGATALQFSSSLSRAVLLSQAEKYLALLTTMHYKKFRNGASFSRAVKISVTACGLFIAVLVYFLLFALTLLMYVLELTIHSFVAVFIFGVMSTISYHRSFAQLFQGMHKTGILSLRCIETEVVGEISSDIYESIIKDRQWRGFWPFFFIDLDSAEETLIEEKLEPFARAIGETCGLNVTIVKAGRSLVQIGGCRFRNVSSIAHAIGADVCPVKRRISRALGRMYDARNIICRENKLTLTDVIRAKNSAETHVYSDGHRYAKFVYRTDQYAGAFQELAEQIQDYPLTIDLAQSNEIEVVRTNIVLLKHVIGFSAAFAAAAWFGVESLFVDKDIDKSAYVLGVYALWVNLGYIPLLGKDVLSFSDMVRTKRKRVIEAVLHNKSQIGTNGKDSCWNYRSTQGSTELGVLSAEEAALTARMCQIDDKTFVALDTCSLYLRTGVGSVQHGVFQNAKWTIMGKSIDVFGSAGKVGTSGGPPFWNNRLPCVGWKCKRSSYSH